VAGVDIEVVTAFAAPTGTDRVAVAPLAAAAAFSAAF
jgi:hypothetical protein